MALDVFAGCAPGVLLVSPLLKLGTLFYREEGSLQHCLHGCRMWMSVSKRMSAFGRTTCGRTAKRDSERWLLLGSETKQKRELTTRAEIW
jgi:hypothetical protein